ncbi:MAG: RNA 2',3'-cyclic phosphodiesterase [Armatimonadota bacterium]|nr:RNA 2',3'-cyclic phosphodiesterase [bacterium]MDW8319953.1 RNA 2',3'-cyclic phosphodiesterase [Armatimonadota bacterium]
MRLFFAVLLDDQTRQHIALVQQAMKRALAGQRISWVKPENLHLTLRFLGELDEEGLKQALEAAQVVARQRAPFRFVARGAGVFPDMRRARVLWVGVEEPVEPLFQLAHHLERELQRRAFPPEDKPFRSHITLARIKEPPPAQVIQSLMDYLPKEPLGAVEVRSFVLMQSILRPDGSLYTPVQEFLLSG